MEGTSVTRAKEIMGKNFIGVDELASIADILGIQIPSSIPEINFYDNELLEKRNDFLLILGLTKTIENMPFNIIALRQKMGIDPKVHEPCFYNQDWYVKERFVNDCTIDERWYLVGLKNNEITKGVSPEKIPNKINNLLPPALLLSYSFFAYYLINKEMLWEDEYVWCHDKDNNGDQIYVGRYLDQKGINKNGFEIHRYLTLKYYYGAIEFF